jgi:hypothetical protein
MYAYKAFEPHRTWLTFDRLRAGLLFMAIGIGSAFSPAQSDTWWQLRAGQTIWRTGAIDLRDQYSHTVGGQYWPNHEWLAQVWFYAVHSLGGMPLLTALAVTLIIAAWALMWRLIPRDASQRVALVALALVPSSMAWSLRPQLFTLFLLALTVFLVARRRYAFLPLLFLIWANLHGGVTLGFVVLVAAAGGLMIEGRTIPVRLLVTTIGCVIASTLTPLGLSLWTEVPASLARLRAYGVEEWRAPEITDPIFLPFWLLAGYFVWLVAREQPWRGEWRQPRATVWSALALLPLACASGRNVPAFLLVAIPAIATLRGRAHAEDRSRSRGTERPALNAAVLAIVGVLGISTVTYAWSVQPARLAWHPLPDAAIAAIASCPERLYNRYDEGGYLIWFLPNRKVFLDSRQDPYPPALIHEQILAEASGDYEPLFDRYAIRCAFVAADSPIANRLTADRWHEVYNDGRWVVLGTRD